MEKIIENSEPRPAITFDELQARLAALPPNIRNQAKSATADQARTGKSPRQIAADVLRVLEEFEAKAPEALAQHERDLAARQQASADLITEGARLQRERARAAARSNALPANEILRRVEQSGFRVRLRDGDIQIAPDHGLSLEHEAYLVEYAELIAIQLAARESFRTVAKATVRN